MEIEEIDTENEVTTTSVNLLEGECQPVKNEPTNDYDDETGKISDGIDHSALEGMINLCEKTGDSAIKPPLSTGNLIFFNFIS